MKIGVLTFHRCINYGSYWQARCLAEGLHAAGHQVVILDHDARRVDVAEWKCALQPTLPIPVPRTDRPGYRRKIARFHEAFEALPLSPRFALDDPAAAGEFDAVVVGSDEVWNLAHPWYGRCPVFYGQGLRTRRLVSFAASFGNQDAGTHLHAPWRDWLRDFDRISVRDEVSRAIVERATGRSPDMVIDPCLQFPLAHEADIGDDVPEAPYAVVYGHGFTQCFIDGVTRWAQRRGLPLVSIGYRNDWADEQRLGAGPYEFARLVARADAMATNFFHGCVFALCNRKPFACEASWYRSNKLRCLMSQVGSERHLLREGTEAAVFEQLLEQPPATAVFERIGRLRQASGRTLQDMLAPQAAAA